MQLTGKLNKLQVRKVKPNEGELNESRSKGPPLHNCSKVLPLARVKVKRSPWLEPSKLFSLTQTKRSASLTC